ncbi:MAG: DUF1559 domain-containing protein [Lacipirellulaceae bacterium]
MRFRLLTVLYVFALLAAGMAVFGGWGILIVLGLLSSYWIPNERLVGRLLSSCLAFLSLISLAVSINVPRDLAHHSGASKVCGNHMRQLALALRDYRVANGRFPPTVATDSSKLPLYSWRVNALPFFEEEKTWELWRKDLPYTDVANLAHSKKRVGYFCCPSDSLASSTTGPHTSYFAITGPDTAWSNPEGTKVNEIGDRESETILF